MTHLAARLLCVPAAFMIAACAARAQEPSGASGAELGGSSLMLRQDAPAAAEPGSEAPAASAREQLPPFGSRGSRYWTVLSGVALHPDSVDPSLYGGLGFFLTDGFEFNFGLSGWYFVQEGDNAGGANPALGFRYHFMPEKRFNVYLEAGIGLLFTTDDVPEDGTSFNFTPRAGVGTLWQLGNSSNRLDVGLRWHHISNASTDGTDDNPSRDSVMIYAGIVVPF
ncbi:MAG: acyloxyacyl hydrolase [Planctomycetota bacterium]|nr:acyloxyacyl hydrolase [Planctomycetota bacterium]